jgi:hypothetical protein
VVVRNDAYYKKVTNPIDDGQFGAGLCPDRLQLCQGRECRRRAFRQIQAPTPIWPGPQQKGTNLISNQFLFDNSTPFADLGGLTEFQYLQTHWVYSDHAQFWTGSAGLAYQFCGRPARRDEIFASYTAAVRAFSGGTNMRRPIAAPLSSFTRYSATNYHVYRSSRQSA